MVNLFFGARTAAECLYREELEAFLDYPGFHLTTAFSREQTTNDGRRMYVQHRMAEQVGASGTCSSGTTPTSTSAA